MSTAPEASAQPVGAIRLGLALVLFWPLGLVACWLALRGRGPARRVSTWAIVVGIVIDVLLLVVLGLFGALPSGAP